MSCVKFDSFWSRGRACSVNTYVPSLHATCVRLTVTGLAEVSTGPIL